MEAAMAEPVPAGSDASAGTYRCTECGYLLDVDSTRHLPPCPECEHGFWHTNSVATVSMTRIRTGSTEMVDDRVSEQRTCALGE